MFINEELPPATGHLEDFLHSYIISKPEIKNILLEKEIAKIKAQVTNPEQDELTIKEFLNLAKNAAETIQLGDAIAKDVICRLIFLNLTVDEEKVLSYQVKPQFAGLLKRGSFVSGREQAINLEPLIESILKNWNPNTFDEKLLQINFFEEQYQKMDYIY